MSPVLESPGFSRGEDVKESLLNARANMKMQLAREDFEEALPMALPPHEVAKVTRAAQLYSRSGYLSGEELAKVDAHVVTFSSGSKYTVKELTGQYQASLWIRDAATLSDLQVARTSQRSAEMIVKALGQLGR